MTTFDTSSNITSSPPAANSVQPSNAATPANQAHLPSTTGSPDSDSGYTYTNVLFPTLSAQGLPSPSNQGDAEVLAAELWLMIEERVAEAIKNEMIGEMAAIRSALQEYRNFLANRTQLLTELNSNKELRTNYEGQLATLTGERSGLQAESAALAVEIENAESEDEASALQASKDEIDSQIAGLDVEIAGINNTLVEINGDIIDASYKLSDYDRIFYIAQAIFSFGMKIINDEEANSFIREFFIENIDDELKFTNTQNILLIELIHFEEYLIQNKQDKEYVDRLVFLIVLVIVFDVALDATGLGGLPPQFDRLRDSGGRYQVLA
jgi:predicted  nucleic acid-binding Zn-ribbon protein